MTKKDRNWDVLKEETILSCHIFSVLKSLRVNPLSKAEFEFLLIRGLDWVNVLGFTENDEIVMVRQYRHGAEQFTEELPGGCIEKGEDPKTAALRELSEETGYTSDNIEPIGVVYSNPAMYGMKNYFFLAKNCRKVSGQDLDDGEDVDVLTKPYYELLQNVKEGNFTHGLCTAAIGLYEIKKKDSA